MNSLGIDKPPNETRVAVAMSGGVDSSTVAALLADEGYDVVGVTMQLYADAAQTARPNIPCAGRDVADARAVADSIGIPHHAFDFEARFREIVVDAFADTYLAGETPVPCARCNQRVKFGHLMGAAHELGADVLATGHYATWRHGPMGAELHRGADATRDQSYFLFTASREQLDRLRFPLGALDKDATRAIARRFGLPTAERQASQDICFIPDGDYAAFVKRLRPEAALPGDIVDLAGAVLGRHEGVIHYTVGQRRGLGIGGPGGPLYVVRLEPETRRVVVGPAAALKRTRVNVRDVNWLGDAPLSDSPLRVQVKLRSTQPPGPASVVAAADGGATVTLDSPQGAVAPGQACVFFDRDRVLGGGWIARER